VTSRRAEDVLENTRGRWCDIRGSWMSPDTARMPARSSSFPTIDGKWPAHARLEPQQRRLVFAGCGAYKQKRSRAWVGGLSASSGARVAAPTGRPWDACLTSGSVSARLHGPPSIRASQCP
jgi:hypothetical protein